LTLILSVLSMMVLSLIYFLVSIPITIIFATPLAFLLKHIKWRKKKFFFIAFSSFMFSPVLMSDGIILVIPVPNIVFLIIEKGHLSLQWYMHTSHVLLIPFFGTLLLLDKIATRILSTEKNRDEGTIFPSEKLKYIVPVLLLMTFGYTTWMVGSGPIRVVVSTAAYWPSWEPTSKQMDEIVSSLGTFLKSQPSSSRLAAPLENYSMQLGGFYKHEEKEPYIRVNAFCKTRLTKSELKKSWVRINNDSGCYFQVNYDPVQKVFYDFSLNSSE
jgi:hypothetical protein